MVELTPAERRRRQRMVAVANSAIFGGAALTALITGLVARSTLAVLIAVGIFAVALMVIGLLAALVQGTGPRGLTGAIRSAVALDPDSRALRRRGRIGAIAVLGVGIALSVTLDSSAVMIAAIAVAVIVRLGASVLVVRRRRARLPQPGQPTSD